MRAAPPLPALLAISPLEASDLLRKMLLFSQISLAALMSAGAGCSDIGPGSWGWCSRRPGLTAKRSWQREVSGAGGPSSTREGGPQAAGLELPAVPLSSARGRQSPKFGSAFSGGHCLQVLLARCWERRLAGRDKGPATPHRTADRAQRPSPEPRVTLCIKVLVLDAYLLCKPLQHRVA